MPEDGVDIPSNVQSGGLKDIPQWTWPTEAAEFVTKKPETGSWRVFSDDGTEVPMTPKGPGHAYYAIQRGDLPIGQLMTTSQIASGEIGYKPGETKQKQRILTAWDKGQGWKLSNEDAKFSRTDYFYDDKGRLIALRQADFPKSEVPYIGIPQESAVDRVIVYKYEDRPDGTTLRSQVGIKNGGNGTGSNELEWSEPTIYNPEADRVYIPPSK